MGSKVLRRIAFFKKKRALKVFFFRKVIERKGGMFFVLSALAMPLGYVLSEFLKVDQGAFTLMCGGAVASIFSFFSIEDKKEHSLKERHENKIQEVEEAYLEAIKEKDVFCEKLIDKKGEIKKAEKYKELSEKSAYISERIAELRGLARKLGDEGILEGRGLCNFYSVSDSLEKHSERLKRSLDRVEKRREEFHNKGVDHGYYEALRNELTVSKLRLNSKLKRSFNKVLEAGMMMERVKPHFKEVEDIIVEWGRVCNGIEVMGFFGDEERAKIKKLYENQDEADTSISVLSVFLYQNIDEVSSVYVRKHGLMLFSVIFVVFMSLGYNIGFGYKAGEEFLIKIVSG